MRSGGQTGVDRAALEVALELGLPYTGWCPRGGWAEDCPAPPGLLGRFPRLCETPSPDPLQRTAWNVRDADATLILAPAALLDASPGTRFTRVCAEAVFEKPWTAADPAEGEPSPELLGWLEARIRERGGRTLDLNVAGPRESEAPGIQERAAAALRRLLDALA